MVISILTLFPEMFVGPFDHSIIKHAKEKGLVEIEFIHIRDFGIGKHHVVDDTVYGGGVGMVMRVDVVHAAIEHAKQSFIRHCEEERRSNLTSMSRLPRSLSVARNDKENVKQSVVLLSARGTTYTQTTAKRYSHLDHLILICGHYEGIDDRIQNYIDEEVSIGDFVLTGGELPAILITDSVTRLISGVLKADATKSESFSLTQTDTDKKTLEHPQFTRPSEYEGVPVPEILLSGDHQKIEKWRKEEAIKTTKKTRPDLLTNNE